MEYSAPAWNSALGAIHLEGEDFEAITQGVQCPVGYQHHQRRPNDGKGKIITHHLAAGDEQVYGEREDKQHFDYGV